MRSLTLSLALLLAPAVSDASGVIFASAACGGNTVTVDWSYYEDFPDALPFWVGYDLYRRGTDPCSSPVRVNTSIIPRGSGNHSRQFVDTTPAPLTSYQYEVWPVDQFRNLFHLPNCFPCTGLTMAGCPEFSVPIAHGTLTDFGWAMFIENCPSTCSPGGYVETNLDELRPYAGTGIALHFYGSLSCGGIEGCGLYLHHFEVADCAPVPALAKTWGSLKASYR